MICSTCVHNFPAPRLDGTNDPVAVCCLHPVAKLYTKITVAPVAIKAMDNNEEVYLAELYSGLRSMFGILEKGTTWPFHYLVEDITMCEKAEHATTT